MEAGGDMGVIIGTRDEVARYWGVSPETVTFYATPAWAKRRKNHERIVVRVEEEI